jgi:hypothetical protein
LQAGFDETDAFLVMYDDHDLTLTLWFLDAVHHNCLSPMWCWSQFILVDALESKRLSSRTKKRIGGLVFTSIKSCLDHAQRGRQVYKNHFSGFLDEVTRAGARVRVLTLSAGAAQSLNNALEGASGSTLKGSTNSAKPVHIRPISLLGRLVSEGRLVHFGMGAASPNFICPQPRGGV